MIVRFGAALLASTSFAGVAYAQSTSDPAPSTQELQREIRDLQAQLSAMKAAQPAPTATATPPRGEAAPPAPAVPSGDGSLTLYGVTLYGTVDVGVAYQNHGTPLSDDAPFGLEYLIQKNSNKSVFTIAPNGLSQSKIGLKGSEPLIGDDLSAVFKLETGFSPTSGELADGPGSLARNNGIAQGNQVTAGDSARAGQAFNAEAYVGLNSPQYGMVTFGRQNSLMLDDVTAYDPNAASYAFSVIGFSGATAGVGDTEDTRLDNAIKYKVNLGPGRFEALYSFGGSNSEARSAYEFDIGADYLGLSVDAVYNHVSDAIAVSALSNTQVLTLPTNSLAATVSDDTSWSVLARFVTGPVKLYAAYEQIQFDNPATALPSGTRTLGGYLLSVVSNTAYTNQKVLGVTWAGIKYSILPDLDLTGAYYRYDQNNFSHNGCSDTSSSACSGTLNAFSGVVDYRFTKRFDVYGGAMFSEVGGGLANGYLHSSTIDPMLGARFNF